MISSLLKASTPLDRRTLLTAGGLSAVGLTLPQLFASRAAAKTATPAASRAPEATAQACILLYMLGGPPQQETFDMKPEAPGTARSLFRPIATNVPGIEICELLPDLARQADRFAILRSVFHGGNALFHGAGVHYNLTGWPNFPREGEPLLDRRDYPGMGAVLNHLREPRQGLPVTVQLPMWITQDGPGREWAGQHAGFLGRKFDPLVMTYEGDNNLPGTLPPGFSLREDVGRERLGKRLDLQEVLGGPRIGDGTMLARDWAKYRAQALEVLDSGTAWKAFELDHESPQLRARYGDDRLGRSCLVASRRS